MTERALYFTGEQSVEHRPVEIGGPEPGELLVHTTVSAISPGTELLVYRRDVPSGMAVDESIDALDGEFSYPLRYGYAAVGTVEAVGTDVDEEWLGQRVFAFSPHQTKFTVSPEDVVVLPEDLSDGHGSLLPTVETAVNLLLDAEPTIGERVVVFGAGPIGLATTHLLAEFPTSTLVVVEPIERRRELARSFGADVAVDPSAAPEYFADCDPPGADLALELSGRPEVLDDVIGAVGYGGRIVVGSWYGTKRAPIDLGGSFHRDDVTIRSSQVSQIAPERRGRWSTDRRLSTALDHLQELDADALISRRVRFERAPEAYRLLDRNGDEAVQVVLTYQ